MRASHQGKGRPRAFDRNEALKKALEVFWRQGYEPASVASLCSAMGINAPSLYASFGNKSALFIEALNYYEQTYWSRPAERFLEEPDIARAVENFFFEASEILLSPDTPCGCMVVLAAINISSEAREVSEAVQQLRFATKKMFADRLYPYSQKNRLRDLKVREAMLLMCGESYFLRSFAGPAESYRQMLGYKRWKDRGRLFVTGMDDLGAMVGNDALRTAEKMGQEA